MCEFCKRFICPPACPSYDGRSAERGRRIAVCRECGKELYGSDELFMSRSRILCRSCYIAKQGASKRVPLSAHA